MVNVRKNEKNRQMTQVYDWHRNRTGKRCFGAARLAFFLHKT